MEEYEFNAYVINLSRRRDRLVEFREHYSLDIPYDIVNAVDGKQLDLDVLLQNGVVGKSGLLSIQNVENGGEKTFHHELGNLGAVGCSLSHIQIWEDMVKQNIQYVIIFEDDAMVNNLSLAEIKKQLNVLPDDWHIFMIGNPHSIFEGIPITNELYRIQRFGGTHAYIINLEGAKWLLEKGKLFPINQQIDAHLSELCMENGLNIYYNTDTDLVNTFLSSTDIQLDGQSTLSWDRLLLE